MRRRYLALIPADPAFGTADQVPAPDRAVLEQRDAAFLDNVSRHLRLHPQAHIRDDQGRPRALSRQEAEQLAQVALRAAADWLTPARTR